ncbi:MAG TPA: cellulose binding domain-containing protein [Actinocrinis sp.]|uniref:cellulose binding domain-containing protein n=1 Tax=Actinocrinis sp. TaxID=1920516 RepID=UPI002DDCD862|nr:cellulose binding domain-containing protein [Actinocrinis sp.]HEV2345028.1 cellulose binding domain-containing protein [Actinocrinis sp.]
MSSGPRRARWLRRTAGAAALTLAGALAPAGAATLGASATASAVNAVNVTVNAHEGLGTIPATGYGLNSAVWDNQMNVPVVQNLLSQAGIGMLRYPGGSYGDIYHWQTNTAPGGYVAPGTDFDSFMGTVKKIGAQPILIANYGTGTPAEAAGWVQYANVTKGYGDKYWEIGNENYGNGYYGADWEADNHASKSPATYANNVLQYISAMKAVDPTIKIGAVLTLPGNWPDGAVAGGDAYDWNRTVLSIAGSAIDFAIVHWYPNGQGAATALSEPSQLTGELAQLRSEINQYAGSNASNIGIALTEMNSGVDTTTQPDALFGADSYMTALEQGVFNVDWWDTHNGAGTISTAPDGATDYNDWGVLSSATCTGSVCEPALNTPFPPYFAISMLSKLGRPGDQMVRAGTDQSLVSAHAVLQANGDLAVQLVNKDPNNAYPVNLHYTGYQPSTATPTVYTYGDEASSITSASQGTSSSQTIAPYSIETVVLTPSGNGVSALTAPGAPAASGVTGSQATISWTPSSGGQVARYEVYQQFGTTSQLLAESNSTSATLYNLVPGTGYTINVLATDQMGNLSRASVPVSFTTSTPSNSTCAVNYQITTSWGSGYVASLTITNTGPSAINGWTLTFSFPATTESFNSGWNANWTSSGQNVHATNVDWDANLAPNGGNSFNIGFVGNEAGAYPSPAAISLNGTVCTTTYSS